MTRVAPHPTFVANITARRGDRDFAPPLPALDAAATWKAAQKTAGVVRNYDRVKNDPHIKRAAAMIEAGALPDPFDARLVAVAERVMDAPVTLVRVIAEAGGLAEMVAIKLDSTAIALPNEGKLTFDGNHPFIEQFNEGWAVARAMVCRADDASYAAARKVAGAWRRNYPVKARVVSSFLFPSETAWANADFDELLPHGKTDAWIYFHMFPLLSVVQDEARVMAMIQQIVSLGQLYQLRNIMRRAASEIVVSLQPDAALRVLLAMLAGGGRGAGKAEVALLGHAMAALEGEDAATELAGLLLHPAIGPIAVDYFRRFPDLAKAVLPKVAAGTSKAAHAARSMLAASKKDDSPIAEGDEVPKLLRDAPWRKRTKTKKKVVVLDVPPPIPPTVITWESAEERRIAAKGTGPYASRQAPDMPAGERVKWAKLNPRFRPVDVWTRWGKQRVEYRVPLEVGLREWNENAVAQAHLGPLRMLAVHGDDALPGLYARDPFSPQHWNGDALLDAHFHAVGPEAARVAAAALVRRKAWRKSARDWITAHAAVVAQSLVAVALGTDSRERKEAENAIRWAARTHEQQVIDAATVLGGDAERAIAEMVERDPLTDLEVKGKLPPFIRVADLPAVRTHGGKRLPEAAVVALLEILRSTSADLPVRGPRVDSRGARRGLPRRLRVGAGASLDPRGRAGHVRVGSALARARRQRLVRPTSRALRARVGAQGREEGDDVRRCSRRDGLGIRDPSPVPCRRQVALRCGQDLREGDARARRSARGPHDRRARRSHGARPRARQGRHRDARLWPAQIHRDVRRGTLAHDQGRGRGAPAYVPARHEDG
jgi:hypothetical protein